MGSNRAFALIQSVLVPALFAGTEPALSEAEGAGILTSLKNDLNFDSERLGQPPNTFPGAIHSPGFEALDFSPPTEVSPQSGIPDAVINLLNESITGADFTFSNGGGGGGGSSG